MLWRTAFFHATHDGRLEVGEQAGLRDCWYLLLRRSSAAFCLVSLLVFTAFAQQADVNARITAIDIQGNVRAELETIRSYLQIKPGETFDRTAADRSLKAHETTARGSSGTVANGGTDKDG